MESLRSQLSFSFTPKIFRAVIEKLVTEKVAVREESILRLPSHSVKLSGGEQETAAQVERLLQEGGFTPPEVKELEEKLRIARKPFTELLSVLESRGAVVKVTTDLYFSGPTLEKAKTALIDHLTIHGEIAAADISRPTWSQPENCDSAARVFRPTGLTLRVGDVRKLRKK